MSQTIHFRRIINLNQHPRVSNQVQSCAALIYRGTPDGGADIIKNRFGQFGRVGPEHLRRLIQQARRTHRRTYVTRHATCAS